MKQVTKLSLALLGAGATYGLLRRRRRRDIRGQTALITGSSRGLGFLLAREYAQQGCRVVICSRDERELDIARDQLRNEGADVMAITCDVSNEREVGIMVDEASRHFGGIDILVNNAGVIPVGPLANQSVEDFEDALDTMFYGMLFPIWAVLPQMIDRGGGRIVNITSIGAKLSFPHLLPYNCAKFAAIGLSEGLHAELGRHNISVTTVVPGLMRTGSYLHAHFKGQKSGEYAWFSVLSSLPLISMNAERAARQIVRASQSRKTEHKVGFMAKGAALFAGIFPALTADILKVVESVVLPGEEKEDATSLSGKDVRAQLQTPVARMIGVGTTLGRRAGRRYNQD